MIYVNQKFIDSCNSDCVLSQIKIRVSATKGGTVLATLNDDEFNISSNSIEKQASSGASCNIGGVCSNRLKIVLNQKGIDKLEGVGGFKKNYVLHLIQWNKVNDVNQSDTDYSLNTNDTENTTGKCDLGFYYISEIKNNYYDCEITAYDAMIAFRKNLTLAQIKYMQTTPKTIQQWLTYFCSLVNDSNFNIRCDGIYSNNANKNVNFTLSEDSSFDTIRDAISQLATLVMGYATINTSGNIIIKPAIKSTISADTTVNNAYMYSCNNEIVESVVCYLYTSIAGFGYESTYTDQQDRNKINLYLEENKFLRGFEPYNGSALSSTTLTCLQNMANEVMGISFYSADCEINNRPFIELGDTVRVERKLVDQQGATSLINLNLLVDSVSHDVGVNTHIMSNSTVSTNTDSMGKTNVNSEIKEPSNSDIMDMISSPVTSYDLSDAFLKIRLDTEESKNFNENSYANGINVNRHDFTYTTAVVDIHGNTGYVLNNPATLNDADLYSKACWEYTANKYFYALENKYVREWQLSAKNSLKIANMSNLIDKQFLYYANVYAGWRHRDPVLATLKGIYFFNGGSGSKLKNALHRSISYDRGVNYPDAYDTAMKEELINSCFNEVEHTRIDTGLNFNKEFNRTGSQTSFTDMREKNGFNISCITGTEGSTTIQQNQIINAANSFNYKDIAKYVLLLGDLIYNGAYGSIFGQADCFIEVNIEYDYNNTHYNEFISLYTLLEQISFCGLCVVEENGTVLSGLDSCSRQIDFITTNNIADNYYTLLKTIYDSIKFNVYDVYLNARMNVDYIESYDKEKVDKELVNQSDLVELDDRVYALENRVDNLNTTINAVNADLQDAKSDIAQNTQDIQANATNIQSNTQAISGLDTRVTALEQGGGGGGSTPQEVVFTNANVHRIYDINITPHTGRNYIFTNKIAQVGADFINLNTTYGTFYVDSEIMCDIRVYFKVGNLANNAYAQVFELSLLESDTAELKSVTTVCTMYAYNTEPVLEMVIPNVRLLVGKYYGFKPYGQPFSSNDNNQNGSINGSEWLSARNRWRLYNYIQFIKKDGVTIYPPS